MLYTKHNEPALDQNINNSNNEANNNNQIIVSIIIVVQIIISPNITYKNKTDFFQNFC